MTIFLYGPDSYRRNKRLNNIIEEYRHKYSNLSCDCFDLENSDEFLRLKEFAAQMLIFDNKKLAVLRNIYEADVSKIKEFLKKYLKSEDFTILISEEKSPSTGLKFLLKESFSIEKFENFKGESWRIFIQKQAGERKLTLAPKAVYFLAESFKEDTWGLINELNKLSLLSQNTPINVEDLEKIGDFPYQSPNIFTFINALTSNYSLSQKVIALEKLFIAQEEPIKIFNILASLKRLSGTLLQKLADYDVMVKSGKMDYEEVLIDLALQ